VAVYLDGVNVMAKYGCFFMSDLGVAETETGVVFSPYQINRIVASTQASDALGKDMVVAKGRGDDIVTAALAEAGSDLRAIAVGWTGYTGPADASVVQGWLTTNRPHWREGDSAGQVVWDPYPGLTFLEGRSSEEYEFYQLVPRDQGTAFTPAEAMGLDWSMRMLRDRLGL